MKTALDYYLLISEFLAANKSPITIVILVTLSFIDMNTKIKMKPITKLFGILGNLLFSSKFDDLSAKISAISNKLDKHVSESEDKDVRDRRSLILDFASAIAGGRNYTKEQFEYVIGEGRKYIQYCADNNIANDVADISISVTLEIYDKKLKENSFLLSSESDLMLNRLR